MAFTFALVSFSRSSTTRHEKWDNFPPLGTSIVYPEMPAQKGYVRGENGPGCWVMTPIPNEPNKCIFQWLLDTNLKVFSNCFQICAQFFWLHRVFLFHFFKGWIPQAVIDTALSFAMCDYVKYIRAYAATLHQEGKFWPALTLGRQHDNKKEIKSLTAAWKTWIWFWEVEKNKIRFTLVFSFLRSCQRVSCKCFFFQTNLVDCVCCPFFSHFLKTKFNSRLILSDITVFSCLFLFFFHCVDRLFGFVWMFFFLLPMNVW